MNNNTDKNTSFSSRMSKALSNLFRAFLIFIIVAGIAAAIYYGTPWIYQKFILPVETNSARLQDVEKKQNNEVKQLNLQINDLKTRMAELENSQTSNSSSIAEMKGQVDALEKSIERQSEMIKQLEGIQTRLDVIQKSDQDQDKLLDELDQQVTISRSVELLSRAYIYLVQNNYGLARDDLRSAYALLADLNVENTQELQSVQKRLEMAITNLPDYPIVAVDDIEAAWQLLIGGFSPINPVNIVIPPPTPESTIESTLQPSNIFEITPVGTAEITQTPTP